MVTRWIVKGVAGRCWGRRPGKGVSRERFAPLTGVSWILFPDGRQGSGLGNSPVMLADCEPSDAVSLPCLAKVMLLI